jgi:hypothetical protein
MFSPRKRSILRLGTTTLIGFALVLAAGCSKSKGTVTGTVKLQNGTPVSAGNITFWASDNHPYMAALKSDGSYSIGDIPVGDVKVTIEPPPPRLGPALGSSKPPEGMNMPDNMKPSGAGDAADPSKVKYVPVPDKYKTAGSTPLNYTVIKGPQEKPFVLEQ